MSNRLYIWVNGVNDTPGLPTNWNVRACPFTNHNYPQFHSDRCEYHEDAELPVDIGEAQRVELVTNLLTTFSDWEVIPVGHSHGAAVILEALKTNGWPYVPQLHLLSAACEADFDKNGLNAALGSGFIGKLFLYQAGKDEALALAATPMGKLLGYGTLGLKPVNVGESAASKITTITQPDYGHSDWWAIPNFNKTMDQILTS
jgi:hypothetical protein